MFMRECIDLALQAKKRGDNPIGILIVRDGVILGRGVEGARSHQDITFHAQIEAIRQATALLDSQDLSECTMYSTHEPCIMCSYSIRHTHISTLVIGTFGSETGGLSSQYPLLLDESIERWGAPPQLVAGVLEEECRALLRL